MITYSPPDPEYTMRRNIQFLREYAKRSLVQRNDRIRHLDNVKSAILDEVWKASESFRLTERDVVVLIYKGVLPDCW